MRQVEVKVDTYCSVTALSTAPLAKLYDQTPRIISVMAFDVSLANKLAAWYERRLLRDLYDTYLFMNMGVSPNTDVLKKRLEKPNFSRNVSTNKSGIDISSFYAFLKDTVEKITLLELDNELSSVLPKEELSSLDMKIKNTILRKLP